MEIVQPAGSGSGVSSLNTLTGAVTLAAGTNITLVPVGNTITINSTGGGGSPLTTKGDLYGYDTGNARIPVGSDGTVLTADSGQALGVKWATVSGTGDMTKAVYDPANISQQLLGITATQTVTNKDLTSLTNKFSFERTFMFSGM